MKHNRYIIREIYTVLFILLTITASVYAQNDYPAGKRGEKLSVENPILAKLKMDPAFKNYFKNAENPNLSELLKVYAKDGPHIDSLVSAAYDTSFQKMKNSYEYDDNGYLTNFLSEYVDDGIHYYDYNYQMEYRPDGQLKSALQLIWKNGVWTSVYRETYTFDPSGNEIIAVYEIWDSNTTSWVNTTKWEYAYDANRNIILSIYSLWENGAWKNNSKYEWTYDTNDNQISEVYSYWISGAWKIDSKYERTYDSNNNLVLEVYSFWAGVWVNVSKTEWTFDQNNNVISLNEYDWTGVWENYGWTLYTYNANNNKTFENEKLWDAGSSKWVDNYRMSLSYNANGKMLELLEEDWDGNNWVKQEQMVNTFDINDNLLSVTIRRDWNGNDWNEGLRWLYNYSNEDRCNGGSHETWFVNHWVSADNFLILPEYWLNTKHNFAWAFYAVAGYEFSIYYKGVTKVKDYNASQLSFNLDQNYPNPFNPSTVISFALPKPTNVELSIYNMLGEKVVRLINSKMASGNHTVDFNASDLSSGVYIYSISAGSFHQTKKMLFVK